MRTSMKSPLLNDLCSSDVIRSFRRPPPPPPPPSPPLLVNETVALRDALHEHNHSKQNVENICDAFIQAAQASVHLGHSGVGVNQNNVAENQKPNKKVSKTNVTVGMQLKKWRITELLGAGSFGEVFAAVEEDENSPDGNSSYGQTACRTNKLDVCIKVMQEGKSLLRLETSALKKLQPSPYVVRYIYSGSTDGMDFLVMQRLGSNLAVLRRSTTTGKFSLYTTLKVGVSCLRAIQDVHAFGLVHRDIKPSNFVVASKAAPDNQICYLIDFGLARRYRRSNKVRPPRENAGFRGTSRYASLASHHHRELGRVDDLWSLLFMLIEFLTGTLPWRNFKDKEDIGRCKEEVIGPGLVKHLPREFRLFLAHLQALQYEDEPNYEFLISLLQRSLERRWYPPDKRLDWEFEQNASRRVAPASSKKKHMKEGHAENSKSRTNRCHSSRIDFPEFLPPPPPPVADERPKRPAPVLSENNSISPAATPPRAQTEKEKEKERNSRRAARRARENDDTQKNAAFSQTSDAREKSQEVNLSHTVFPAPVSHQQSSVRSSARVDTHFNENCSEGLQQDSDLLRSPTQIKHTEIFLDGSMTGIVEETFSPREGHHNSQELQSVSSSCKEQKSSHIPQLFTPLANLEYAQNETQKNNSISKHELDQAPAVVPRVQKKSVTFALGDIEAQGVTPSSSPQPCKKKEKKKSKINCNCVVS